MDFIKDLLGKKLDPAQFDAIMRQIELRAEQDEARDRAMEDAIRNLSRTVEELAGTVADYNTQLRALSARIDSLYKQQTAGDVVQHHSGTNHGTSTGASVQPDPKPHVEPKPVVRRFYATLDSEGHLREVGDNYRNKAPFVADVKGDSGEAAFNAECLEYCLPRAESAILPFFDYTIESATPTAVMPKSTARITRHGDVWEMDQRIKITLS